MSIEPTGEQPSKTIKIISWICQILAALILFQTLFFKFSGAPEAIYIFTTLGAEPFGRIGSGVAELIIGILLLIPRTAWLGAIGGLGTMVGAIGAHLFTPLGVVMHAPDIGIENDPSLFILAVVTFIACAAVVWIHRSEIPVIGTKLQPATT